MKAHPKWARFVEEIDEDFEEALEVLSWEERFELLRLILTGFEVVV